MQEFSIVKENVEDVLLSLVKREVLQVSADGAAYESLTLGRDHAWIQLRQGQHYQLDFPAGHATHFADFKKVLGKDAMVAKGGKDDAARRADEEAAEEQKQSQSAAFGNDSNMYVAAGVTGAGVLLSTDASTDIAHLHHSRSCVRPLPSLRQGYDPHRQWVLQTMN